VRPRRQRTVGADEMEVAIVGHGVFPYTITSSGRV
jgi:hypothetical protein